MEIGEGRLSPIHIDGDSWITVRCQARNNEYCDGAGMEVTKCGARLVDKKAIEDLKQSMTGCSMIPSDGDEL
ncbi:TMV resistance protein N-like isoform X1, partial [Fagus crenata]